jgi:hypothetical protein
MDTDLSAADLKAIIEDYKKLVQKETKKPFPQDAHVQLAMSRDAVFRSWWNPKLPTIARWKKFRMKSAPPPTCRPWYSAIWAIPRPPAWASHATPPPAKRFSTASF